MVVGRPALLAKGEKVAEPAEVDRVGVGRAAVLCRVQKPLPEPPVVGEEVVGPERLALPEPGDDVHGCGPVPLDPRELLGVEAELKHVLRLGFAGELSVDDLVATAVGQAFDEVGEPTPGAVGECRLVDDVDSSADGLLGFEGGPAPVAVIEVDRDNAAVLCLEPTQVGSLVVDPLAPDELSVRVVPERLGELLESYGELERGEMLARQERVEVGR